MLWTFSDLDPIVGQELDALPRDMRARFERICRLIASEGLDNVGMPYVRHLEGKLWEIRMTGRDGIGRAIYLTRTGRRIVLLRVFVKKTQKTPRREIEIALARAEELS